MATVQEIKDALLLEQQNTIEVSQTAIAAIDTLLNLSMYVLGVLAILLALLSIWGITTIRSSSEKKAKKVANDYLKVYIESDKFKDLLEVSVKDEVKSRVGSKVILNYITEDADGDDPDPFPKAKEANKDGK